MRSLCKVAPRCLLFAVRLLALAATWHHVTMTRAYGVITDRCADSLKTAYKSNILPVSSLAKELQGRHRESIIFSRSRVAILSRTVSLTQGRTGLARGGLTRAGSPGPSGKGIIRAPEGDRGVDQFIFSGSDTAVKHAIQQCCRQL